MLPHLRHISHATLPLILTGTCVLCSTASADEVQARVVARVDQHPLHADEVRYFLPATERKKPVSKVAADVWKAAIELAIDRRLVVAALARHGKSASDQDVDFELQRLHRRLAQRESKIAEYLARRQISIASFRQVLLWQLTWQRYLSETVTDDNLEKYFQKKHRDFDGTQLRVAHILWKWPTGSNQQPREIRDTAKKVRQAIVAGEFSFAEAAARYSAAPTADMGGEVGWISRHEPMSPEFNKAAFQLSPNQMSQPVVSLVGVHLIYCLEVKPGQRTWQEARAELIAAVRQYLFHWLADRERKLTTIELVPQSDE